MLGSIFGTTNLDERFERFLTVAQAKDPRRWEMFRLYPAKDAPWIDDHLAHPDVFYRFVDAESGLLCEVRTSPHFGWNGYVHFIGEVDQEQVDVHGGITGGTEIYTSPEGVQYNNMGFDCAHAGDVVPTWCITGPNYMREGHYWTFEDVKQETVKLARQIRQLLA